MNILDYVIINMRLTKNQIIEFKKIVEANLDCKLGIETKFSSVDLFEINAVSLLESRIVFARSSVKLRLDFDNHSGNLIIFLIASGSIEFNADKATICRRGDAFAMSVQAARYAVIEPGTQFCALAFRSTDGTRLIERLTGRPQREPLMLASRFRAVSSVGRALAAIVTAAIAGTADEAALARSPHAAALLQDSMIALLLENLQHNHSGSLAGNRVEQAPWPIRKAIDYILANARDGIGVGDVAAAAGISVRALQQNFQRSLETSPQDYIKTVRLQGVRRELLDPSSRRAIEDIASEWGFVNRGHFAKQYRRLFGELPSQTRRSG